MSPAPPPKGSHYKADKRLMTVLEFRAGEKEALPADSRPTPPNKMWMVRLRSGPDHTAENLFAAHVFDLHHKTCQMDHRRVDMHMALLVTDG